MNGLEDSLFFWAILGFLAQLIGLIPATLTLVASYYAKKYNNGVGSNLMMAGSALFFFMIIFNYIFTYFLLPKMIDLDNLEYFFYGKAIVWFVINTLFALGLLLFVKQLIRERNSVKAENFL